ncbi:MAG: FAD-dependent oxidoreductase [Deltaproteobacteria bacterium]|nr:FAD-dependent oxidoreductase [Deltaproteobacteria bacterium]
MSKKDVVILGGGFAGLSAGVELAALGHKVHLLEQRGHLGGRAYSFRDPATGSLLDNGQHLFMGCYQATLRFLERIGRREDIVFQRRLAVEFGAPGGKFSHFRSWSLPNPWHLLGGLFSFSGLSWREKRQFLALKRGIEDHRDQLDRLTIPQWLQKLGQSRVACERFWNLIALAALNDDPEISSAAVFQSVLREALFSSAQNACLGFSRVGLSELYADPARAFIEEHGGSVFLKTRVVKLHFSGHELREIELLDGRRIAPEILILAIPFGSLRKILPEWMIYQDPFFHSLRLMKSSPIVAINLWFDRDFVEKDFIAFWETRIHWLFNKGRLLKDSEKNSYYSLVISGARAELQTPASELVSLALSELESIFPKFKEAKLIHSHVMKEPEATLSPVVGIEALRPSQKTPFKNVYLAGDWTDTGLPATIEGAVRSAERVVKFIINPAQ